MKTLATATVRSTDTPYRQDIETRGFHLVGDEPPEPAGPGPYDYFLTGLGMCTTITLQMYAERKGWDLGTVSVSTRPAISATANGIACWRSQRKRR